MYVGRGGYGGWEGLSAFSCIKKMPHSSKGLIELGVIPLVDASSLDLKICVSPNS